MSDSADTPTDQATPTPTPTPTGPTAADWAAVRQQLEELQQHNEELRRRVQVNHTPSNGKLGYKPDRYDGSRKPRAVENWVKSLDDYFELNPSQAITERMIVLTAATYLAEPAKGDYNAYITKHGEFATWHEMKKWLLDTYNPVDPMNTYRVAFFYELKQRQGESPDSYYRRFLDALNLLDLPIHDSYVRFHFGHTLLPYYKMQILADTEFAKWEKPLDDIVAKMKRMPLPPSETTRTPIPNTGNTSSSMTNNKRKLNSSSMTSNHNGTKKVRLSTDDAPLTDGQRRFLDQNIARGGGIVLSEALQNKTAWIKEARQQNLCINCAGSGHRKIDCPATKHNDSSSSSSFNAIFPGADPLKN